MIYSERIHYGPSNSLIDRPLSPLQTRTGFNLTAGAAAIGAGGTQTKADTRVLP